MNLWMFYKISSRGRKTCEYRIDLELNILEHIEHSKVID